MSQVTNAFIGSVVKLSWNGEAVQVVDKGNMCVKVRSILNGSEREIACGCGVLPYEGKSVGGRCACGCGRIVIGTRSTRMYATSACKVRVSKRKGQGNRNSDHSQQAGNRNLAPARH
jgi:hypothetical protein